MSAPSQIRARAARVVHRVVEGRSLDAALADADGPPAERGLLKVLSYGTIRWYLRLVPILERLLTAPVGRLDPEIRALSLVGLFQVFHTDIAAHAVVSETVNAARVLGKPRAAGLVNALLRRAQREAATLAVTADGSIALKTAHPAWFVEALQADWPGHAATLLDANNAPPPFWLRVNRSRVSRPDYQQQLQAAGLAARPGEFAPEALLLPDAVDVHALPGFASGDVSVQDAAAQLAAHLLGPRPGERILDACAAPGGKTCHLLELEPRLGEVVAMDVASERLGRLKENLDRLGLSARIVEGDAADPGGWWDGQPFDRILLDVPCSATGVIRRHPDIKLLRRPSDITGLAKRQALMLERLWPLLKPGGRLLYASCSVLKAENAGVVAPFLAVHPEAGDVTAVAGVPLPPAGREYVGEPGHRIRPGEAALDGFYYACLQKSNG